MFTVKPLLDERNKQRITYAILAKQVDMSSSQICRFLNGQQAYIRLDQLSALCKALGVNETDLIK